MALTAQERRKLLEKARAGGLSSSTSKKTNTPSPSVVSSQRAASDIREGVRKVRSFQNEVIAEARAKMAEGKKPVISQFNDQIISAPTEEVSDVERGSFSPGKYQREQSQPVRDFLRNETPFGKLLFGESEQEYQGIIERPKDDDEGFVEGLGKDIQSKGVITGLLYGEVLKSPEERFFINNAELKKLGYEPSESEQYARQFIEGDTKDIPEAALSQLKAVENTRKAWAGVELLDAFPVFRSARLTLSKSFIRDTVTRSMSAESAVESRRILSEAIPDLKGSEELEDLITTIRQVADPVKGEQVIRALADASKRTPIQSTEAQRVFYQNGIPLVRGSDVAQATVRRGGLDVPNQTSDALALRREINDVIAGQAEQSRLSNLDVFADEIKAGALPFKASVDDQIEMFMSDAIKDATRLRSGDRLATSREVLEETLEKGTAKTVKINPDDVVRLSDGTFVYAPKESLAKGVQATLRGLRESQRAKVANIERRQAVSTLKKQLDSENQRFDARITKQERQAAARAAREAERSDARRVLEEREGRTKRLIDETVKARDERISTIRAKAKETKQAATEARQNVKKLTTESGKIPKKIAKERAKARKAIDRVRDMKTLTPKERVKRITKIRKQRDTEIARLTKEKKNLDGQTTKARAKLIEAKSKVVDRVPQIRKVQEETKEQIKTLKADTKEAIAKAEKVLEKPKPKTPKQKARARNTKEADNLANAVQESFTVTAKEIPDTVGTSLNPVKGEGKTVENQIIQGLQDEVETIKKHFKERGLSLADLPDTHQAISNTTLMKQAFADLVEDPAKVYSSFVNGDFPKGATRAAYGIVLMKSDFVLQNPARMDMVARAFYKGNTRIAQELQSVAMIGRMDYLNIVGRFSAQADEILKARGVDVEAEASKLLKRFNDEFDDLPPMSKAEAKSALDSVTCPV